MSDKYPKAIEELSQSLKKLPGIGRRSADRMAMSFLDWTETDLKSLGKMLIELHDNVHECKICANLGDEDTCRICQSHIRNKQLICVVENPRQIPVIEQSAKYNGVYHVLGGKLSPLDGIELEDLNIDSLRNRIENDEVAEVIIATSPDVEGEATASFLAEELKSNFEIKVSRIASGVPVGADLSFTDAATIAMAIDSRREIN